MGTVYKTVFSLIFGIATGLFAIGQLHLPLGLAALVATLFLSATVPMGFLYLRYLESQMGVSIFRRPRLELKLETTDTEKVRTIFYTVSRQLASTTSTVKSGEKYVMLAVLEDHTPYQLWLELDYLWTDDNEHQDNPSKSAECWFYFDELVLIISCGYFAGKHPFELLEKSFTTELAAHGIGFKELFKRRPH
jgi:hypothetical protein